MVGGGWWWVAYRILVSAPVLLVLIGCLIWVGLGWGWALVFWWDKVLGTGLDNWLWFGKYRFWKALMDRALGINLDRCIRHIIYSISLEEYEI